MTNSRVIGIDFDDVVFDLSTALAVWHNREHGTSYSRSDVNTYNFASFWGCTFEEAVKRVDAFVFSPDHVSTLPVKGAIESLRTLKKNSRLVSISSRPEFMRGPTEEWLKKHDVYIFETLHFLGHFHGESKFSKADICLREKVSVCIDDSLSHAQDIAAAGVRILLFDTPWNQGPVSELVTRIFSWEEILEEIG